MAEGTNLYRYTFTALNAYSIPQYTLKEKGEKGKPHLWKEGRVYPEEQVRAGDKYK